MRPQSSRQALQLMIKLFVIGLLPITLLANAIAHTPVPQIITDFIGFLTMMTVATTAYLGICYITLHQRELRNEQRPQAPSGIDFGELKAMTKSQKDPLAALYLSLCASGIVLATVGLLLIGNSEMEGLVILYTIAILLVLGGGAALIVTGYFRPAASHTHSLKRFAERNNFTLTSGPVSDSTVMNGLAVLFPERKTKIYFLREVKTKKPVWDARVAHRVLRDTSRDSKSYRIARSDAVSFW